MPRKIVISKLEESDFSLLLRPDDERYAKAGFPTKSVEAMYQALLRVSELNNGQIDKLKEGARRTAELSFDFRIYTDRVKVFIDDIQK